MLLIYFSAVLGTRLEGASLMPTPHLTASAETRPACVPRENTPYDNYVITSSPVPADRHSPNSRYVCDWMITAVNQNPL